MESVKYVHVRHDLVADFDSIIGARLSRYLGQSQRCLGIDESRINRHTTDINHPRIPRNSHRTHRAQCCNLAALHHQHAVLDSSVRNRKQLPTPKHNRL